eukprot:CAMPEP_0168610972 /NCGR_PEP_ID=MMETSP0449_2-20121227/2090_1 /TAXON_ID=1082188 /ORGANISM="Strombidium rassoulzadegani, Strain ras09" /LENGTH=58 /DNA_ID=CAMNT_0008651349 /DNA_START=259 /DNA_END=435 /DNA_ORIENTATION=-
MNALYSIWGWVGFSCEAAAYWQLFINDGGQFYNECYYMFYNGVVWYKSPEPYDFGADA